ncbi:MAG: acetylornithine deacetylase [Alphaproteobacteria bacterium]
MADLTPRAMIDRLVGFDTVSSKSNLALIEFAANYLDGLGIKASLVHDAGRTKANLFATIGPDAPGGACLSGHTDVVPVAGQPWDTDPFKVVEKGGNLYGRGSSDMKSFLAIALALVPEMKAAKMKRPIHLALSFDEEVGCLGAPLMIKELGKTLPKPALVVIGEPTSMKVVNAHKGSFAYCTTVTGLEAHSSATHKGVSAIQYAAEIIHFINAMADEFKARAKPGVEFEPPYTTLSVGIIEGGTAINIISRQCRFHWDVRLMPGGSLDEIEGRLREFIAKDILPKMRAVEPNASVSTEKLFGVPGLAPEPNSPAEQLCFRLTGANSTAVIAFGTEGGQFQEAGIPTVVCGPGSIHVAHKPNEYISLEQVEAGIGFQRRLIQWAAEG